MTPPEKIPSDYRRAVPREDVVKTRAYREAKPWFGPPSCTDSDGGTAANMADVVAQATTPGKTTAYVPVSKQGQLAWKKIEGTDGCKTPTLLLEHSCLKKSGLPGSTAVFAFHYLPCPTGTACAAATDAQTGVSGGACVPVSPSTPPPAAIGCDAQSWHGLDLETNSMPVYVVQAHDEALFAGGMGGVQCWDPGEMTWQTINAGFASPEWADQPLVVDLASYGGSLYGVLINSGPDRLYRWVPSSGSWELVDAPIKTQSLLVTDNTLYLGDASGVRMWASEAAEWVSLGQPLESTVRTLYRDGAALLAGTFAGDVHRFAASNETWTAATPPLPSNYVHALQRYGEFLYVGAEWALYRCWTETGVWDLDSACEQIEPETGFTPELSPLDLHVHNGVLHVATSAGVRQFDAATDTWLPLDTGLADLYGAPAHTLSLATYAGALVVGTLEGVYRWGCEE